MSLARILVTSTFASSFIAEDIALLRKHFEVQHLLINGLTDGFRIDAGVRASDAVFCWFASTYAALTIAIARSYRKKTLLALGGVDVADLPRLGYGIWTSRLKGRLAGYAIRHADRVIAVDPSLIDEARRRTGAALDHASSLPTGIDESYWTPDGPREGFVLTVAAVDTRPRLLVKGFELLCDAASMVPQIKFVLVGVGEALLADARKSAPLNMEVCGRVSREEMRRWYLRAKVYCQPSLFEGLPNALLEAMSCGCIPVGTDVGGIRAAIGSSGFVVGRNDPGDLSGAVSRALATPDSAARRVRAALGGRYTLALREEGLIAILGGLLP